MDPLSTVDLQKKGHWSVVPEIARNQSSKYKAQNMYVNAAFSFSRSLVCSYLWLELSSDVELFNLSNTLIMWQRVYEVLNDLVRFYLISEASLKIAGSISTVTWWNCKVNFVELANIF